MTPHRLALYWAPERHDPLPGRGPAWRARYAESGAALS